MVYEFEKLHVIRKIVFLLNVCVEPVRHCIQRFFSQSAYETFTFHVSFHALQLITKFSERIDDQT